MRDNTSHLTNLHPIYTLHKRVDLKKKKNSYSKQKHNQEIAVAAREEMNGTA
jgi:hypothetical protein